MLGAGRGWDGGVGGVGPSSARDASNGAPRRA